MEGKTLTRRQGRPAANYQFLQRIPIRQLTVTVLMGGPSAEREVSLASGRAVAAALGAKGHRVIEADIGPDDFSALDAEGVDVVFPVLHGTFGEDGQLQDVLEQRGLRYAGSGPRASRLAMNKYRSKAAFKAAGLLTPAAALIEGHDEVINERHRLIDKALAAVGLPCVVKPNQQGSSIGVVIAESDHVAHEAAEVSLQRYGDCLIEGYVAGREVTVGILDGVALPMLEIRTHRRFYDYQAKYQDNGTQYDFDIGLTPRQLVTIKRQAMRAFRVLGCRDFARVDLMVDSEGRGHLLEINTIPGFTDHSLLPKAAGRAGMSMAQLCDRIVQIAYDRPI